MKKIAVITVLFAFAGAVYGASSVTSHATPKLVDEINVALQSYSTTGDITLANGATIDEAVADSVRVTVASTTSTLGVLILESDNVYDHMSDGDTLSIQFKATDSTTTKTAYATTEYKANDVTDSTEDGAIVQKVFIAGTATAVETIDANGITVGAGSFVGNAASITNIAGGNIASGNIAGARIVSGMNDATAGAVTPGTNWNLGARTVAAVNDATAGAATPGTNWVVNGARISTGAIPLAAMTNALNSPEGGATTISTNFIYQGGVSGTLNATTVCTVVNGIITAMGQ